MRILLKIIILLAFLFIAYRVILKTVKSDPVGAKDIGKEIGEKVDKVIETGIDLIREKLGEEAYMPPGDTSSDIHVPEADTFQTESPVDYYALTILNYESVISSKPLKNQDSVFIQQFATKEVYRRGRIELAPDLIYRFGRFVAYLKSRFPGVEIVVTSGVRTRQGNYNLENASTLSHHLTGDALDICVRGPGISKKEITKICGEYFDIVIDDYDDSHIHVSMRR